MQNYLQYYSSQSDAVGKMSYTPFVGMIEDNDKILYVPSDICDTFTILDDGNGFITYINPANTQICYTTTDGNVFNLPDASALGLTYTLTLTDNTYDDVKGTMTFNGEVVGMGVTSTGVYPVFATITGTSTVKSVIIPDSVTCIGQYSFYGCTNLENVSIPNSVTSISQQSFYGCSSLTEVYIPDSVESIGYMAFAGCTSISTLKFGKSLKSIGAYAFSRGTTYTDSITTLELNDGLEVIGSLSLNNLGCSTITLPKSLKSIGVIAFGENENLTEIKYKGTVEEFGLIEWTSVDETTFEEKSNGFLAKNHLGNIFNNCNNVSKIICTDGVIEF